MEHGSPRAFYLSRFQEETNDSSTFTTTTSTAGTTPMMSSARTFDMSTRSSINSRPSARSVQYINPAVYIEKEAGEIQELVSGSTSSIASIANSNIVPPLDLQSESFPTRREGYTFSYRHNGEPLKLKENPELAYENWLSAKRKILSDKAAKRKQEEEMKQREKEERKRLAQEKYQKWLEAKQLEKAKQLKKRQEQQSNRLAKQRACRPSIDVEKVQEKIEEWERNKRMEEEHRREMRRLEKEKRQMEEKKRRQLAQEAWNKWIREAPNKPKPVPLNRGLFTLRGTISDIFINPNEWKSGDGL